MPLQAATSGSSPGIDVGAAFNNFMASMLGSAQVVLGVVLLGLGAAVVISQTSAGQAIGGSAAKGAGGLAKRGLRLIPGVGAVV